MHLGHHPGRRIAARRRHRRQPAEPLHHQVADALVLDVADRHDDQVRRDVGAAEEIQEDVAIEGRDRLGRAEDRPAQRVPVPEPLREELVDEVVGRVLDHLDLFEDHLLLALDVVGPEGRIEHDVGQDVPGVRQVLVEHLDVVARVLLRRERIEVAAERVDRLRDVFGGPGAGALEEHVLDEVRRRRRAARSRRASRASARPRPLRSVRDRCVR